MCDEGPATGAVALVETLRTGLDALELDRLDDTERLALLRAGEDLTRRMAALGVRIQVAFAESQVAEQAAAGIPLRRRGLAVADDIAAARKTSPSLGSRELSSARALVAEMPRTLQALEEGTINAYQSRVITEATTCLSPADRAEVDERLAGTLAGASNAEIGRTVRGLVYELDPAGFVARARKAAADRGVSVRPAPDVMAVLSARLTAPHAVACYKALRSHAVAARASGDPRSLNQLMADELVSRLTGRTVVDGIDVEVGLVMTDAALFDGASDPADLEAYGPIPAEMARDLLRPHGGASTDAASKRPTEGEAAYAADSLSDENGHSTADSSDEDQHAPGDGPGGESQPTPLPDPCPDGIRCASWDCPMPHGVAPQTAPEPPAPDAAEMCAPVTPEPPPSDPRSNPHGTDAAVRSAKVWLRRLYADPVSGVLTARDPRRRAFAGSLRAFLIARDRTCRNSWCGAPIRDVDHIVRHRDGGTTDADNGRGLCHRCNLARERERHHEPPPGSYRSPPPAATSLLGRPLARAPAPRASEPSEETEPRPGEGGRQVA